mmetsp:Transcript_7473/g.15897  ORF Transcript_7473/g.15897 Transcript_7473/m.15897 type:complete len:230 (+) Transcript_7473:140-829(+)
MDASRARSPLPLGPQRVRSPLLRHRRRHLRRVRIFRVQHRAPPRRRQGHRRQARRGHGQRLEVRRSGRLRLRSSGPVLDVRGRRGGTQGDEGIGSVPRSMGHVGRHLLRGLGGPHGTRHRREQPLLRTQRPPSGRGARVLRVRVLLRSQEHGPVPPSDRTDERGRREDGEITKGRQEVRGGGGGRGRRGVGGTHQGGRDHDGDRQGHQDEVRSTQQGLHQEPHEQELRC